jgi:hypothetical protein
MTTVASMSDRVDDFGQLFGEFVRHALEAKSREEPPFRIRVREHLGVEPSQLPVLAEEVAAWDHANLQLALEALLAHEGRTSEVVGIGGGQKRYMPMSLSDLVNEVGYEPGSVEYENLDVGPAQTHPCMQFGLVLLRDARGPAALLVRKADEHQPRSGLTVEAMTADEAHASELLAELRRLMRERNVFRGQMISLESTMWGQVRVAFHERPAIERDDVVLPADVLADVERQTLTIGRHAAALRAGGRHLKRGLLLHGPPGTGKTHTVKWIAGALSESTVILLSGGSLGVVGPISRLARELAPSLVVLEDVDLVAEERTAMHGGGPILFELLNELDGMADDADVAVILTTNRPDLLEPALAARPGRVDLAVEIPLPDEASRRRLFELYARGLKVEIRDVDAVVARTAGVTSSFFRELARHAALEAAERDSEVVHDEHVAAALDRLLDRAGAMTRILLGAERPDAARAENGPRGWMRAPMDVYE